MKRATRVAAVSLCAAFSALCSYAIRQHAPKSMLMCDFGEIYYAARCVVHRQDPYNPQAAASLLVKELAVQGVKLPDDPAQAAMARTILSVEINLPTTLFLLAPFAMLPWAVAQNLWTVFLAGTLALGALLVWDLGAKAAPDVWLLLAGFLLANCQGLLLDGNAAGLAVSLCVIATWCFLRNRYALLGAALFAVSLLIKPHDSGFVWLYFLLAGSALRKRALQTLAFAVVLTVCASIWIAPSSPHWPRELHENLALLSARGATDPGISGTTNNGAGQIVDLQAVLSILWNNPLFYNLTTYLIVGALILVWILATPVRQASLARSQVAIAAISVLSLLPFYHRSNDAKLLLLAIPACAVLWISKGPRRWIALLLTSASIFFTADMPLAILGELTRNLTSFPSNLSGKLMTILLRRPTPLVLLATGCFYLWVYLRYSSPSVPAAPNDAAINALTAESAT